MLGRAVLSSVVILLIAISISEAQTVAREKKITASADTVVLDTVSIIPGSVTLKSGNGNPVDAETYIINYARALLIWKKFPLSKEIIVSYRVFPILLTRKYYNKSPELISETAISNTGQTAYQVPQEENNLFTLSGLTKSGSISRSIGIGNNQDLSVNSNLVLQLSGKITDDVEILAAVSDDNIPIQADGTTQQINEFDKVFIQLKRKNSTLMAGDYEIRRPEGYFMNFFKRTQGGSFSTFFKDKAGWDYKTTVSAAIAKGRSSRNQFLGQEGNQGPYRLTGNNDELFIIILSGTERVYIDGVPLLRGQDNDYVIDYNTAELAFTPRRLITQNSRISIEFEYSDKNYARQLQYVNQEVSGQKLTFRFNFYNEQDNPGQPFLQTISDPQKQYLEGIGNNISQAFFPNADSTGFNANEVLYKKTDTLGVTDVYVYSTNASEANYRVGFSFVGQNAGDYILNPVSAANGRVFEFVPPINGVKQGNYDPITLLITPKTQQLVTLGIDYRAGKRTGISNEIALSNNDVNLFSELGAQQNKGFAYKLLAKNEQLLTSADSTGLKLLTTLSYEFAGTDFKALERYRTVEFERDFNLAGQSQKAAEHLAGISIGLFKDELHNIAWRFNTFIRQQNYIGYQQSLTGNYSWKNNRITYNGNVLNADADQNRGNFFRQRADVSHNFGTWVSGINLEQETNSTRGKQTAALTLASFAFTQLKVYANSNTSQTNRYKAEYSRRYDKLPFAQDLQSSSVADVAMIGIDLTRNPNSVFGLSSTYRKINYNANIARKNESTLLGRIEHNLNVFKGMINANSYYELGTGQEPKREFTYLEVQAGQGAYTWNDYNQNTIKELGEFELSRFTDQAKYIRVFRPTNEFIATNYTAINQTVRISPASFLTDKKLWLNRLSNQTSYKIERKVLDGRGLAGFNPFNGNISAENLVSLNSFFRNTLFYNRNNPVFGIDLNYQNTGSRILLTNGFDARDRSEGSIRLRWNIARKANLVFDTRTGNKRFASELFTQRNYFIRFNELVPELNYQLSDDFRLTMACGYIGQQNRPDLGGEKTNNSRLSAEGRYNILKKGVITSRLNFINNNFTGNKNSPVAYELLDGLQPGNNLTWGAGLQRSVANGIQLNFTYDGRRSPGLNTIHTGGMQVRAFF